MFGSLLYAASAIVTANVIVAPLADLTIALNVLPLELAWDAIQTASNKNGDFIVGGYLSPVTDAYGKQGLAPAAHRVKMCELATASSSWIMVDSWESSQTTYKYTMEVINHFLQHLNKDVKPGEKKVEVKLLCGSDLLDSFNVPNLWSDQDVRIYPYRAKNKPSRILMMADICSHGIVCIERVGANPAKIIEEHHILKNYANNILIVKQWITNEISSTKVRYALKEGLSIKYLTPDPVVEYIERNGLYKPSVDSQAKL